MDQRDDREGGGDPDGQARAIGAIVGTTERVEGNVAIGLMAICIGLPVIGGVVRGHPVPGVANAILLGLVGWGLVLLVQGLLLQPISIVRYHRAADRLARTPHSTSGAGALHHSWADGAPGAITVAADGRAWLADRSTAFRPVTLPPDAIVHAEAVSISTMSRVWSLQRSGWASRCAAALRDRVGRRANAARAGAPCSLLHYRTGSDTAVRVTTIPFPQAYPGASAMAAILSGPRNRAYGLGDYREGQS